MVDHPHRVEPGRLGIQRQAADARVRRHPVVQSSSAMGSTTPTRMATSSSGSAGVSVACRRGRGASPRYRAEVMSEHPQPAPPGDERDDDEPRDDEPRDDERDDDDRIDEAERESFPASSTRPRSGRRRA